jgi:CsoR family transcriptional regulator, copper-sensing transcriptional repressor
MTTLSPNAEGAVQEKTKLLNRLKRVEGQVRGLQRMIEEERDCQEVLSLLAGVRSALNAAGDIVLETYLEKCRLELETGRTDINDLVRVVKLARG